jgi:hypothetical protein
MIKIIGLLCILFNSLQLINADICGTVDYNPKHFTCCDGYNLIEIVDYKIECCGSVSYNPRKKS